MEWRPGAVARRSRWQWRNGLIGSHLAVIGCRRSCSGRAAPQPPPLPPCRVAPLPDRCHGLQPTPASTYASSVSASALTGHGSWSKSTPRPACCCRGTRAVAAPPPPRPPPSWARRAPRAPGISPSFLRPFCVASSTSTRRFLRAVRHLLERRVEGVVAQVLGRHEHIVLPRHGLPAAARVRLDTTHRQSSGPLAPPTVAPCIVGGLLKMPRVNVSGDVSAALSMFTHSQARSAGGPCLSASGVGPAPCGCRGRVAAPDAGGGDGTPGGGGGRGAPLGVGSRPRARTPPRSRRYVSRKPLAPGSSRKASPLRPRA